MRQKSEDCEVESSVSHPEVFYDGSFSLTVIIRFDDEQCGL